MVGKEMHGVGQRVFELEEGGDVELLKDLFVEDGHYQLRNSCFLLEIFEPHLFQSFPSSYDLLTLWLFIMHGFDDFQGCFYSS